MATFEIPHQVEPDLNARLAQKKEQDNLTVQDVPFMPNPEDNIRLLANTAYEDKPEEAAKYYEKITASLKNYLKPEYDINTFWHAMAEQGCNLVSVLEGALRFFKQEQAPDGSSQKVEISIRQYLDIKIPATTSVDRVDAAMRSEVLATTKTSLADLLAEIQNNKAA